ncbi:MAG TPA: secretin N-terminal domain-containing protein, partial [Verrucomicrobiae bacterium]|nr:secretin N-terminal domain-containing protein [Verrucomicrobiae bacterium]
SVDKDVGRLYGKVRITSEPYSNALIVTSNSKENLAAVEDVLKQLDQPSEAGESTFRLGLRFASASTVANSINILFAKGGAPPLRAVPQPGQQNNGQAQNQPNGQQQPQANSISSTFDLEQDTKEDGYYPWLGGQPENTRSADGRTTVRPVSDLVGKVRVVPDPRSNALLISANVHFFPQVLKLIQDLDAPTPQVMIEARIVEVSSDFLDRLGVRWSPNGSTFTAADYDNSMLGSTSSQYNTGFAGTTRGGSTSTQTTSSSTGGINSTTLVNTIAGLRTGMLNNTISMDFLVQFLHETTHATVLGSPQMNVRDNEMGKLFVGQQVPFITQSQNTDVGALNQSFAYKPVGVILEVTPHINIDGDVSLKIHAESSSIVPGQTLFGGAIIDTRYFKTDLEAKDGQTLVLGGIIQKQVSDTLRKTPILGEIPGLKWLFNKKDTTTQEVELIVFLRPKVVRNPHQAQELLDEVNKKAPLVKKWQEDNDPDNGKKDKKNHDK